MNTDFLTMLNLYSSGLWGSSKAEKTTVSKKVCNYAMEQSIYPLFYAGIENLKRDDKIEIPNDLYFMMKQLALQTVVRNEKRLRFVHSVFEEFEKNNISYCVLKGETLSLLYPDKSCRISGDTDILIDKAAISQVSDILANKGFELEELFPTSHHLVGKHPVGGVMECHFELYDKHVSEPLFKGYTEITEDYIENSTETGNVKALGINDGFNFVFFHYIKHFLSEGTGIRQVTDVLMYIKQYKDKIDWEKFLNMLKELRFEKIFDATLTIGTEYLQFAASDFPVFCKEEELAKALLEDIQSGGNFGHNDADRRNFAYLVLERKQSGNWDTKLKKWYIHRLIYILFPHKKVLEKRYTYLQKTMLLYPIAWLNRLMDVIIKRKGKANIKNAINPSSEVAKIDSNSRRLDLMKQLNIFD